MSKEVNEDDDKENINEDDDEVDNEWSLYLIGFVKRENIRRIKRTLQQDRRRANLKAYYRRKAQREAQLGEPS